MKTLPPEIVQELQRLHQPSALIELLDIAIPDGSHLRLANYTDDVVFGGNTYYKFNFDFPGLTEDSKGSVVGIELKVSNVDGVIQGYMQQYQGGVGFEVVLYLVNSAYLESDYAELTWEFSITASGFDEKWATFQIGAPNLLRRQCPPDEYTADHCPFIYADVRCGHAQDNVPCDYTLAGCRGKGNSPRYGGEMGLSQINFRLV